MRNHTVGCVEIPTHNWYYNWLQLKVDPQTDGDWINGASDVLYNKFGSVCVQESASHRHPGGFLPLLVNCEIASVVDALNGWKDFFFFSSRMSAAK